MNGMIKKSKWKKLLSFTLCLTMIFSLGIFDCFTETGHATTYVDTTRELTSNDIPDSILYAKLKELADTNKDNKLIVAELQNYTGSENGTLNLSNLKISNIKGLGFAKGVKNIDLSGENSFNNVPDNDFKDCANLESIILPDAVTSIGVSAFEGCTLLKDINLPSGLNTIGDKSFLECKALTNISLPTGITTIGNSAFSGNGLNSIELPNPDINIGANCFNGCRSLTNVVLPEGMNKIPTGCFSATGISEIYIPSSITSIEEGAFTKSMLFNIDLSACTKLTAIKTSAFSCTNLSSVKLPESLTQLGSRAFESCIFLPEITIPSKITTIDENTFCNCPSLKKVIFTPFKSVGGVNNYNLQEIKSMAFFQCTGLGEDGNVEFLKDLDNLTSLGAQAFGFCSGEVVTPKLDANGNVVRDSYGKIIYDKVKNEYGEQVYYGIKSVKLPESLSSIDKEAFSNCSNLIEINIPNKVTALGDKTFLNCYNLQKVSLSNSLVSIGANCFEKCRMLNDIQLPQSLNGIGNYAFLDCASVKAKIITQGVIKTYQYLYTGIENLMIPDSVTNIGIGAFKGCFNLKEAYLPSGLKDISNSLFEGCSITMKGPDGKDLLGLYKGVETITFPTNFLTIGSSAFKNCCNLKLNNEDLANSIKTIGSSAFENCMSISNIVFPNNLEAMGTAAFKNTGITGIIRIPKKITKIESNVFEGCNNITSVELPDGLTSIGNYSFKDCYRLTSINIPSNATIVYSGSSTSFYGCESLTNAIVKPIPADISVKENSEVLLPVKFFSEITSVEVENENIATAEIRKDIYSKPQVAIKGILDDPEHKTVKVKVNGAVVYQTGRDATTGAILINRLETSVEFNVSVTAIRCTSVNFQQPIRGIRLDNKSGILLKPDILPLDTTDIKTWSSDDKLIAEVDSSGKVTPNNYGSTIIRLKVGSQPEVQCTVNVCVPASSLSLNKTAETLVLGKSTTISSTVGYSSIYNGFKTLYPEVLFWSSSDEKVATVDQAGNVKTVGYGDATIKVRADASGIERTCKITVIPEKTNVFFDKTQLFLTKGDTDKITMTLDPYDSPLSKIGVTSSNSSVASVSITGNVITINARGGGTSRITATPFNGQSAVCDIKVNSPLVSITATSPMNLDKGYSRTISIKKEPLDATDNIIYISDNTSVAIVDGTGKVTGLEPGTATITIMSANGLISTTCDVVVKSKVTGVTLDKTNATLNLNSTMTLTPTISPSDATNKAISWSSSNANVAKVDENGNVTGVGVGSANITAKTVDGGYIATCSVKVVIPTSGIYLDKTKVSINKRSTLQLIATVLPSNATNKAVTWSSSNNSIAMVDSYGKVTAIAKGTATITAKTSDGRFSATCYVTVNVPVTGVALNKTSATINKGTTLQLTATVQPIDATNKSVTWSSSNINVAKVDAYGKVTSVGVGTAIIFVKTVQGGYGAACIVTVKIPVTGVSLNKTSVTINKYSTLQLTATVLPSTATNKKVIWSSSNTLVAKVDSYGKVTAVSKGIAIITAKTEEGSYIARCTITVKIPVTSVYLSKTSATLYRYSVLQLLATVNPSDASNKSLTWASSNTNVAYVDSTGRVTARAAGTAIITVKSVDSGKTATCTITVK